MNHYHRTTGNRSFQTKYAFLFIIFIWNLFSTPCVSASQFTDLYVFGDSLSDSGQYPDIFAGHLSLRATNRIDPLNPNSETAMVWSQYFSSYLGFGPIRPSNPFLGPSGNNYAVVKYTSGQILSSITDKFLVREPQPNANALYVIWGGGNDILNARNSSATGGEWVDLASTSMKAVDNIISGVETIRIAGGCFFIVPNLPDIGNIPESYFLGNNYVAAGNAAARIFNDRLLSHLNTLKAKVVQADVRSFFSEMIANPVSFGFSDENHMRVAFDGSAFTGVPAFEGTHGAKSPAPDPSRYLFYDGIHPTTTAANMIAQYYLSILAAPSRIAVLAESPLSLARIYSDSLDFHLQSAQAHPQKGKFYPFVSTGYDHFDTDATDFFSGYDSHQIGLAAGISYFFSDNLNLGVQIGQYTSDVEFDQNNGGFDLDALFVSALIGYRFYDLSLNGIATFADLDYTDITRNVGLGPVLRRHKGETSGDYYSMRMRLSLELIKQNRFVFGPFSSLHYQDVEVHGYTEDGNISTTMRFNHQSSRSLSLKAGAFGRTAINTAIGLLLLSGDVGYEKEYRDHERSIGSGLITLPGSSFELPISYPETGYWLSHLCMGLQLSRDLECTISYHVTAGSQSTHSNGLHLLVQTRF
jgi:outer membrane lipase/esterase